MNGPMQSMAGAAALALPIIGGRPPVHLRPKSERTLIRLSVAEIMKIEGAANQPASGKEGGTPHKGTMS